jgi:hypothetical protein
LHTVTTPNAKRPAKRWGIALLIPLAPVILVVLLFVFTLFVLVSVGLNIAIWTWWCLRGRDILFVYSDSPIWHDYIEQHILPHLRARAIVLNWSRRQGWRLLLARMAVHHFGGWREFSPMAVVFRPFRRTRTFRFWQPFRDFKHGHPEALHRLEEEFFALIGVPRCSGSG